MIVTNTAHLRIVAPDVLPEAQRRDAVQKIGTCSMCGGRTVRSWRTGILHRNCRECRYAIMMYGPNIKVRRVQ